MRRRLAHTLRALARKIDNPPTHISLQRHQHFINSIESYIMRKTLAPPDDAT